MPIPAASFGLRRCFVVALLLLIGFDARALGQELTYERDVRPILKTHCFHCHGEGEQPAGGLDLRLRRLIAQGGESGPAFVVGDKAASLLWSRLHDGEMPPEEASLRPSEAEVETIANWIAGGAVASQSEPPDLNPNDYLTPQETFVLGLSADRSSHPAGRGRDVTTSDAHRSIHPGQTQRQRPDAFA